MSPCHSSLLLAGSVKHQALGREGAQLMAGGAETEGRGKTPFFVVPGVYPQAICPLGNRDVEGELSPSLLKSHRCGSGWHVCTHRVLRELSAGRVRMEGTGGLGGADGGPGWVTLCLDLRLLPDGPSRSMCSEQPHNGGVVWIARVSNFPPPCWQQAPRSVPLRSPGQQALAVNPWHMCPSEPHLGRSGVRAVLAFSDT